MTLLVDRGADVNLDRSDGILDVPLAMAYMSGHERLDYEITLKSLLFAQRHESNPYRQMYERTYLERAPQRDYDPLADGPVSEFLGKAVVEAIRETADTLEKQGNWYPDNLSEDLPPALRP